MSDDATIAVLKVSCAILMILVVVMMIADSIIHRRLLNVCKEYNKVCRKWENMYSAASALYDYQVELNKVAIDEIELYKDKYEAMVEKFGEVSDD